MEVLERLPRERLFVAIKSASWNFRDSWRRFIPFGIIFIEGIAFVALALTLLHLQKKYVIAPKRTYNVDSNHIFLQLMFKEHSMVHVEGTHHHKGWLKGWRMMHTHLENNMLQVMKWEKP
jgi:hypothetical protein